MQKKLLEELGKAAYEARKAALVKGVYPKRAFEIPSSNQFYDWDEIPAGVADATQWLYRKEAEEVLNTFFMYVFANGSPEAQMAMDVLLKQARDIILTDVEKAIDDGGERQQ